MDSSIYMGKLLEVDINTNTSNIISGLNWGTGDYKIKLMGTYTPTGTMDIWLGFQPNEDTDVGHYTWGGSHGFQSQNAVIGHTACLGRCPVKSMLTLGRTFLAKQCSFAAEADLTNLGNVKLFRSRTLAFAKMDELLSIDTLGSWESPDNITSLKLAFSGTASFVGTLIVYGRG